GDLVRLDPSGGVEVLGPERRRHARVARQTPAWIVDADDEDVFARAQLVDVSASGAALRGAIAFAVGRRVVLAIDGNRPIEGVVVRRVTAGPSSTVAVEFETVCPDVVDGAWSAPREKTSSPARQELRRL